MPKVNIIFKTSAPVLVRRRFFYKGDISELTCNIVVNFQNHNIQRMVNNGKIDPNVVNSDIFIRGPFEQTKIINSCPRTKYSNSSLLSPRNAVIPMAQKGVLLWSPLSRTISGNCAEKQSRAQFLSSLCKVESTLGSYFYICNLLFFHIYFSTFPHFSQLSLGIVHLLFELSKELRKNGLAASYVKSFLSNIQFLAQI